MIKLMAVCQFIALWEGVEERTGCRPLSVVAVDSVYTRILAHQHPFFPNTYMEEANIHHIQYKLKNLFRNKDQEMRLFPHSKIWI